MIVGFDWNVGNSVIIVKNNLERHLQYCKITL